MTWRLLERGSCLLCGSGQAPLVGVPLTIAEGRQLVLCGGCLTDATVATRAKSALTKALQAEHAKELAAAHARLDQIEQELRQRDGELESQRLLVERVEGERDQAVDVLGQVRTIIAGNLSAIEQAIGG